MTVTTKLAGLLAGLSAVAVIGTAVAQGTPPNPLISNHPIAAGQQSSQFTAMGETGVPAWERQVQTAIITPLPEVATVYVEPAPVAVAPAPAETVIMGAPPAPIIEPAAPRPIRADRN